MLSNLCTILKTKTMCTFFLSFAKTNLSMKSSKPDSPLQLLKSNLLCMELLKASSIFMANPSFTEISSWEIFFWIKTLLSNWGISAWRQNLSSERSVKGQFVERQITSHHKFWKEKVTTSRSTSGVLASFCTLFTSRFPHSKLMRLQQPIKKSRSASTPFRNMGMPLMKSSTWSERFLSKTLGKDPRLTIFWTVTLWNLETRFIKNCLLFVREGPRWKRICKIFLSGPIRKLWTWTFQISTKMLKLKKHPPSIPKIPISSSLNSFKVLMMQNIFTSSTTESRWFLHKIRSFSKTNTARSRPSIRTRNQKQSKYARKTHWNACWTVKPN